MQADSHQNTDMKVLFSGTKKHFQLLSFSDYKPKIQLKIMNY